MVGFGLVWFHINHCRLYNAKSCLYIYIELGETSVLTRSVISAVFSLSNCFIISDGHGSEQGFFSGNTNEMLSAGTGILLTESLTLIPSKESTISLLFFTVGTLSIGLGLRWNGLASRHVSLVGESYFCKFVKHILLITFFKIAWALFLLSVKCFKYCCITVTFQHQPFFCTQFFFYLTHRKDSIWCYYCGSEWTWEQWQWRGTPHSLNVQGSSLAIRWF